MTKNCPKGIWLFLLAVMIGLVNASESNFPGDGEIRFLLPLERDTFFAITTENIWQTNCTTKLTRTERQRWEAMFQRFSATKDSVFENMAVRIGVRFGSQLFYIDTYLDMLHPDGKAKKLTRTEDRERFRVMLDALEKSVRLEQKSETPSAKCFSD